MPLRLAIGCCVALILAAGALAALPARVTLDGVAGVVPGMQPDEVARRWDIPIPDNPLALSCQTVPVRAGAMRGHALFVEGTFGAVFFRQGASTPRGIRIGSTVAELKAAYGRQLTSRPNKYTPGARDYFVRRARAPHWELRFDVSPSRRVTVIAFGDEAVRLVEDCA